MLLLDEAGVHRYEEFLDARRTSSLRTNTRDVGMVRHGAHSWEFTERTTNCPRRLPCEAKREATEREDLDVATGGPGRQLQLGLLLRSRCVASV